MIETQPLAVEDFSKGVTDFYIDGAPAEAQEMDNLIVTKNRKIKTRPGSELYNPQLPLGASKVGKLAKLKDELFAFQANRIFKNNAGAWLEISGPSGGNFIYDGTTLPIITDTEWRNHLLFSTEDFTRIAKLYPNQSGVFKAVTAGLPSIPSGVSITSPTGTGQSYLYKLCFRYTYMNNDLEFVNFGPEYIYPTAVTGGTITSGNTTTVTLPTSIPSAGNYDTANIKIDIYRTTTNGDTFYLLSTVSLGTASYTDNNPDANILGNETIYTTGGVLSFETPPLAKYVHAVNDFGYYAYIKESSTEISPTLVLQSSPGAPEGVPRSFFANTEQAIKGLSSIFNRPLVFCEEYIYRIDNFFDSLGDGGMSLIRINDTAGCVSQESIVRTPLGIFWAGKEGFYWSDGFDVKLVSPHLPTTYKNLVTTETRQKNIKGTYDKAQERVYWTASRNETTVQDSLFVLHMQYRDADARGCFTTWSGGTSFKPTAILQVGDYLYRGDSRGFVLRHNPNFLTDPRIDELVSPSTWSLDAIIYRYASSFLDFGSKFYRKFVPRILISASNTTNLSLAISSSNDNDRVTGDLKPIRYTSNITWGDTFPLWGDATAVWNTRGLIEQWRRFPAGGLRCNYKQIILTNAKTQIVTSDLLGVGAVNPTTKTMVLNALPEGLTDYFVSFESDNYAREFKILSTTATTLTYEDPDNTGPQVANSYKFTIQGYPKGQSLELNGYVIHWAFISKSHTPFSSSSLGSNP